MEYPIVFKVVFWLYATSAIVNLMMTVNGKERKPRTTPEIFARAINCIVFAFWLGFTIWN